MKLAQLLQQLPIDVEYDEQSASLVIQRVAPLNNACEGALSFLSSAKYRADLLNTKASAVFVIEKEKAQCPKHVVALVVSDPYLAYAYSSHFFDPVPRARGVLHATAIVDPTASLGDGVTVDAYAVIEANAVIANGAHIGAQCYVGEAAHIGSDTRLQPRVTIAHGVKIGERCTIQSGTVIGCNGFGYAPNQGAWQPIAQVGTVIVGDRVEIGANCTIDRGAIEDTRIDDDVIIDNMVHVAHNVVIGKGCAIAAQVGFAGSTTMGEHCTVGGQSGFAGHIHVAANSHFTGQAMVTKGTTEAGLYSSGLPAQANGLWRKMVARLRRLDQYADRIDALEKKIKESK